MSVAKQQIHQESYFEPHELFFSRTQKNGVIVAGNRIFAKVSAYPIGEMLGRAHSIVRHGDMPRAVFKYMWSEILAGRTISAYVKNLSADGKYYWVLASIFPHGEHFVSVRIKPLSSTLSDVIAPLYQELRSLESSHSLPEQVEILQQRIIALGYDGYTEFMRWALSRELEFAQQAQELHQKSARPEFASFHASQLSDNFIALQNSIGQSLKAFDHIGQTVTDLTEAFEQLKRSSKAQSLLPYNLTMASQKSEVSKKTMEALASMFRDQQQAVHSFSLEYQEVLNTAKKEFLDPLRYEVGACYLQITMMNQFLQETISSASVTDEYSFSQDLAISESQVLAEMTLQQFESTLKGLSQLRLRFIKVLSKSQEMDGIVKSIASLAQLGHVEVSHDDVFKNNILPHLHSMRAFSQMLNDNIQIIESSLNAASRSIDQISRDILHGSQKCTKATILLGHLKNQIAA